jgi:pyridoxal phosphate enzyme (YggS family)
MFNKEKYLEIKKELPASVRVLAATKTKPKEEILNALESGIKFFGENYVQEAEEKYSSLLGQLCDCGAELHLIGHLQSNKVNKAVELFDCIQTIDSIKIARKINEACKQKGKKINGMIEINFGEEQKSGAKEEIIEELMREIKTLGNINLTGLMCVPPIGREKECFSRMLELKQKFNLNELSMGMSNDYKLAAQYGATIIRLGTILFGERPNNLNK